MRLSAVLGAALVALAGAAASGRASAPGRGGALNPADADAAFAANEADLHALQAAASRKDALIQAGAEVTPSAGAAHAGPGEVVPEIEENPAVARAREELEERREESLTREGREALEAENAFHAQLLDPHARAAVLGLMNRLLKAQTFVRLRQPVRGGHLVRYSVVRGSDAAVQAFAAEFGIAATGSSLDVAAADGSAHVRHDAVETNHHIAGVVVKPQGGPPGSWEDEEAPAAGANFPGFVDAEVSKGKALELAANNKHEADKLACPVCERFAALSFRLARDDTYVRFFAAIPKGHTADYELVRGSRAAVKAVAVEVGLQADDNQITAPATGDAVQATAEVTDGFEAATTNEGAGEPINF